MTGNQLKAWRQRQEMTQAELAAALGVSVQWISMNEQRAAGLVSDRLAACVETFKPAPQGVSK